MHLDWDKTEIIGRAAERQLKRRIVERSDVRNVLHVVFTCTVQVKS
jgi:hypothetical protein